MIALSTPTGPTMAMKIKKIKCPRCKKKVWASNENIARATKSCQLPGVCGLDRVELPAALLLPAPKEEEVLAEGEYEFEFSDPLVIHIVDKDTRYVNE